MLYYGAVESQAQDRDHIELLNSGLFKKKIESQRGVVIESLVMAAPILETILRRDHRMAIPYEPMSRGDVSDPW